MQTGFWKERQALQANCPHKEIDFQFMTMDGLDGEIKNSVYTLHEFLHGVCDIFADKLHEIFGYRVEHLFDAEGYLCHTYCVIDGKKPIYVDVRGMCDDWDMFVSEFDDFIDSHDRTQLDIRDTLNDGFELTQEEMDAFVHLAEQAIELRPDYYCLHPKRIIEDR